MEPGLVLSCISHELLGPTFAVRYPKNQKWPRYLHLLQRQNEKNEKSGRLEPSSTGHYYSVFWYFWFRQRPQSLSEVALDS